MTSQIQVTNKIEQVLIQGDLGQLNPEERLNYYKKVCESLGLNPMTQPFSYISLQGKLTLYAKRDATEQLRKIHKVSINIVARETIDGVYVVTARATDPHGRCDESTGAVNIQGLKGEALANAFMKCETKAKRRVTLSVCGLGMLDEAEVESIPQAKVFQPKPIEEAISFEGDNVGEYVFPVGTKFKGKKLKDIPVEELMDLADYAETNPMGEEWKVPLSQVLLFLKGEIS